MHIFLGIASTGIGGNYLLNAIITLFVLIIYYSIKKGTIIVPKIDNFYILILFGFTYTIFGFINDIFSASILLLPIIMYYCGTIIYNIMYSNTKKIENNIKKCILSIAFGTFTHAMLNYFNNLNSLNRNITDFWTKESSAATLQGTFVVMILSLIFYYIFCEKKYIKKIILIICSTLSIMFLTLIGTRTPLIIMLIVFFLEFILYMILNNKIKKHIKLIFGIIILIIIGFYAYDKNIYNIKNYIEESNLYLRLGEKDIKSSDTMRFETQLLAIKSLINNPFGTKDKIGNLQYAHNMWFDIGKDVGIIPFMFLLIYTLNSIISILKIIKNKEYTKNYKIFISSIYLGILISFCIEPILQGIPYYFGIYTLINAIIDMDEYKKKHP